MIPQAIDFNPLFSPRRVSVRAISSAFGGVSIESIENDRLIDEFSSGLYGGLALKGSAVNALCTLLGRLDWEFEPRILSGAMPHFPENFSVDEIRVVLYRLGFEAVKIKRKGNELFDLPDTALLVDRNNNLYLKPDRDLGGNCLIGMADLMQISPTATHSYTCFIFDKIDQSVPQAQGLSWMSETAARFAPELRILIALIIASNFFVIVASLSTIKIFDTVLPSHAVDTLAGVLIGLLGLLALEYRLRYVRSHLVARIAGRIEYLLGTALFSKLMSMPLTMLTANSINDQVGRLKQFETVRDFFSGPIVTIFLELPFAFFLFGVIFYISAALGLLTLGIVSFYVLLTLLMFTKLKRAGRQLAVAHRDHSKFLLETIEHRAQIARMGIGTIWLERHRPKIRRLVFARRKMETVNRVFSSIAGAATPLSAAVIIVVGATMVMRGEISGGQLIGVTMLSSRLFTPIQQAALALIRAPELVNLCRQIDVMMRMKTDDVTRTAKCRAVAPEITFDGVTMRYPKSQNPALIGVSFSVKQGELVAIKGHSGAGKSSLLRVVLGLYPVQVGAVQVGGINIAQLNRSEITSHVAYVSDNPTLIHGTIAQNLLMLSPERSLDDVSVVARKLGLIEWIEDQPDGYRTRLDQEKLTKIPPGIRALISVAQALLSDPPILLLDETFSGLPPEKEQKLLDVLEERRGEQTTIFITQRPSHHRLCDRVFSMSNARLKVD